MRGSFFALRNWFRPVPLNIPAAEVIRTRILLATPRHDDVTALQEIFERSRWSFSKERDWPSALLAQEANAFPVVLCDRDLPGQSWKEGVKALIRMPRQPAIILLSDVVDPYLWDALIQVGGFDVLSRPLRRQDTLSAIAFAHLHWKTGWPERSLSCPESPR